MGMDDKLHQKIFADNLALIDTPLIATTTLGLHYTGGGGGGGRGNINTNNNNFIHNQLHGVLLYPFNISEFQLRHSTTTIATAINGNPDFDVIDTAIGYGGTSAGAGGVGNGNGYGGTATSNSGGGVYYQSMSIIQQQQQQK